MTKGFALRSDNGATIKFIKLNPKSKSYDMLVKINNDIYWDEDWHKVGIIRNIDKLRQAFDERTKNESLETKTI